MEKNEFIQKMEKYIYVKDNKYELSSDVVDNKAITAEEIVKVRKMLFIANKDLDGMNGKVELNSLSVQNGITVKADQKQLNVNHDSFNFAVSGGVCKLVKFWWGVYAYLTAHQTNYMIYGATTAACALMSALFPELSWLICTELGGLVVELSNQSLETVDGCVVSYNYVEGPQQVWAQ